MKNPEIKIEYPLMHIKGFRDEVFSAAKLQRISSPPVKVGTVRYCDASALARLGDIFRCGKQSRNYADFVELKNGSVPFGPLDADTEWAAYNAEICRAAGCDRLELFQLAAPACNKAMPASRLKVKYRKGIMNDTPYLIAGVRSVMASPAAIWLLTYPQVRESALWRLYDVFRIGMQGQAYKDLLEYGSKIGRTACSIRAEWDACERAVLWEIEYSRRPDRAPEEVRAKWANCEKEVLREEKRAIELARRL